MGVVDTHIHTHRDKTIFLFQFLLHWDFLKPQVLSVLIRKTFVNFVKFLSKITETTLSPEALLDPGDLGLLTLIKCP